MLKGMFKKTAYIHISGGLKNSPPERKNVHTPEVPEGLWQKCPQCHGMIYREDLKANFFVCPKCGHHLRMGAQARLEMILDQGSFEDFSLIHKEDAIANPLDFKGYPQKVLDFRMQTGLAEAVVAGRGRIDGQDTVIAVMDASFFMGSMGHGVGEIITDAVERATRDRLPVIIYCCSGGARMQEGMISLMQMAKTSAALKKHGDAGLAYFSVLTDPTTGGVTASFAMLGDIIMAEPGALVGFAGPRVIEQTIGQKLPKGFQRPQFLLEHGLIDRIVPRSEQKSILSALLRLHCPYDREVTSQ